MIQYSEEIGIFCFTTTYMLHSLDNTHIEDEFTNHRFYQLIASGIYVEFA